MSTSRAWILRSLVGALSLLAAPVLAQVDIIIDDVTPSGTTAVVNVRLAANGASVGGMQNDIIFDNTQVQLSGVSACRINAAIGLNPGEVPCEDDPTVGPCKNLNRALNVCGASPQPEGCPEGAGTNISVFRGIIAATAVPNTNTIPDGVLYSCTFNVVGALPAELTNSNVVVSNPTGTRLDSSGTSGTIGGDGGPTPTQTTGAVATPTATTAPIEGVVIRINDAPIASGMAVVNVSLESDGENVGGMQNDIIFDNTQVQLSGVSACRINAAIGLNPGEVPCEDDPTVGPCKNLNRALNVCGASPQPEGCPEGAGSNISVFRGIIAATAVPNTNSIPDGVLYTCTFTVPTTTTSAELVNSNVVVSNPTGTRLDSTGVSGVIGQAPPTEPPTPGTPMPTATQPPTNSPTVAVNTPTRTNTAAPTNTSPQATASATATKASGSTVLAQAALANALTLVLVDGDGFPESGGTVLVGTGESAFEVDYSEREGNTLFLVSPLPAAVAAGTPVTLVSSGGGDDDDGCHINTGSTNSNAWMLLIPALGLLALRGRRW